MSHLESGPWRAAAPLRFRLGSCETLRMVGLAFSRSLSILDFDFESWMAKVAKAGWSARAAWCGVVRRGIVVVEMSTAPAINFKIQTGLMNRVRGTCGCRSRLFDEGLSLASLVGEEQSRVEEFRGWLGAVSADSSLCSTAGSGDCPITDRWTDTPHLASFRESRLTVGGGCGSNAHRADPPAGNLEVVGTLPSLSFMSNSSIWICP